MKILVCFKVLPDPDRILDPDWENFSLSGDYSYAGLDFNCFDQSALEIGLQLKQQAAVQGVNATCTALTVSEVLPGDFAQRLYSAGFDEVVNVAKENREFCPDFVASVLAQQAKGADVVLCGKEASMAETGMVPYLLAEKLGYPLVSGMETAAFEDDLLKVTCRTELGMAEKWLSVPGVLVMGNSPEVLRMATLRARMKCRGMQAEVRKSDCTFSQREVPQLHRPVRGRSCTMLDPRSEETFHFIRKLFSYSEQEKNVPNSEKTIGIWENAIALWPETESVCEESLRLTEGKKLVILPDTEAGRKLAVRWAAMENRSCLFDCTIREVSKKTLTLQRPVFGANLKWTKVMPLPAVITCRELPEGVPKWQRIPAEEQPVWLVKNIMLTKEENPLLSSRAAVICGNGMGRRETCDRGRKLAENLGAAFGLTRPAAMNAWGSPGEIVGQSGCRIAPRVCLTLGAAGAGAFLLGIEHAGTIIAVNTDPHALIFKNADYGIMMDARVFVEKLLNSGRE